MTDDATQTEPATLHEARQRLLDAAMMHVPFDGWSEVAFRACIRDSGLSPDTARAACPRGALDLAVAFHRRGDAEMVRRLQAEDLSALRFRDKIATAVRYRIEASEDREIVRRASSLFALPQHAAEGTRLIWTTAGLIWDTLGDASDDVNWYTKRATLSGVYASTVLFWLGDDSDGAEATWEFLDRRIEEVMQIEKAKARVGENPVLRTVLAGPIWLAGRVRPPRTAPPADLPGHLSPRR